MNHFLKTPTEIKHWLNSMDIEPYTLTPDETYGYVVDVTNDVLIQAQDLKQIPVKFNTVGGNFYWIKSELTSLLGCPRSVGGSFDCSDNQLTTLEHAPQKVGRDFNCSYNRLTSLDHSPTQIKGGFFCIDNHISSLKNAPTHTSAHFDCSSNALTSLEFCPKYVGGRFFCDFNQILSLEFCPDKVSGEFFCSDNPMLGHIQEIHDFQKIHLLHQEIVDIKKEKHNLNQLMTSASNLSKHRTQKI